MLRHAPSLTGLQVARGHMRRRLHLPRGSELTLVARVAEEASDCRRKRDSDGQPPGGARSSHGEEGPPLSGQRPYEVSGTP